jgi:hypothetical protein
VFEVADPVEVDHIVADYIAGIAVRVRGGTAVETVDIADFSSPAA